MVADDEAERHALGPHHVVAPKPDAR
jgi:hypothetical protein